METKNYNSADTLPLFTIKKNQTDFPRLIINSSKKAYDFIGNFYGDDLEVYESFFLLLLDRSSNTIGYSKISQGGICGTVVDIKIILKYAIDSLCSGVVLAHNHPSGNLKPSEQDINITKRIKDALNIIDVQVVDHIILTANGFYSFSDEGNL